MWLYAQVAVSFDTHSGNCSGEIRKDRSWKELQVVFDPTFYSTFLRSVTKEKSLDAVRISLARFAYVYTYEKMKDRS